MRINTVRSARHVPVSERLMLFGHEFAKRRCALTFGSGIALRDAGTKGVGLGVTVPVSRRPGEILEEDAGRPIRGFKAESALVALRAANRRTVATPSFYQPTEEVLAAATAISNLREAALARA